MTRRRPITILPALTARDRDAIFRLRYRIYVEEMHRPQKDADHQRRRIHDALDGHAHLFGAWVGDEIVGTVRGNILSEGSVGEYQSLYDIDPDLPRDRVSITTRLMVLPEYRRTGLVIELACKLYARGLDCGVERDYIDCNAHLVSLFSRLGYKPHRAGVMHPEYGNVTVMRLDTLDAAHLNAISSPFAAILASRTHREATA